MINLLQLEEDLVRIFGCRTVSMMLQVILLLVQMNGNGLAAEKSSTDNALEEEAVSLLSRYIQIDTSNPPGNEIKAAQFFKAIFDREGIEARIIESAPGRGNIYARLRGQRRQGSCDAAESYGCRTRRCQTVERSSVQRGRQGRLHLGARRSRYEGSGDYRADDLIWRSSATTSPLRGDVIFLGTADEEAGGALGAGFLLEKHPDLFENVGVVLNEGGGIRLGADGKVQSYSVSVAEKDTAVVTADRDWHTGAWLDTRKGRSGR